MKTKLSSSILLVSVALLSVVGAAVAFSTNNSLNNVLLTSRIEVLADEEDGDSYDGGELKPGEIIVHRATAEDVSGQKIKELY